MEAGIINIAPVTWPDAWGIAERLSASYTAKDGHRAFDILHVATALQLGAREFLTFDDRQAALAKKEGLILPL